MPDDPSTLTLALVLTAAGATIAAGLVTGLVQILKSLATGFMDGKERLAAFLASAVLVILAMGSAIQDGATLTIAFGFAGFLAWFTIARLSMAVYADLTKEPNGLTGPPA
jgi:hypothetical protein